jgi:hypothetical protein
MPGKSKSQPTAKFGGKTGARGGKTMPQKAAKKTATKSTTSKGKMR